MVFKEREGLLHHNAKDINDKNHQFLTHRMNHKNELMAAGAGRMVGRDSQGVWVGHVHTAIFKMVQQGPTVQHRKLCSMLCGSLDGRGICGRLETCISMAEFLCCPPETVTTLFISCTPIQSKKLKKTQKPKKSPVSIVRI